MKKRIISILLILSLTICNIVAIYANTSTKGDNKIGGNIINNIKKGVVNQKQDILETETEMIDLRAVDSKSVKKQPIAKSNGIMSILTTFITSTPTDSSKIHCSNGLSGNVAVATSKSTVPEDYIYAKARAYNSNDILLDTDENSEEHSSFVSATAKDDSLTGMGDYAYGNHVYQLEGYKDVIHETYDEW